LKRGFERVLLIDDKGNKRGIMPPKDALAIAKAEHADIMIVNVRCALIILKIPMGFYRSSSHVIISPICSLS